MSYRLAYLHLTLINSKVHGQAHEHLVSECFGNLTLIRFKDQGQNAYFTSEYLNKKAQHRSWHTAKCNILQHLKWNINAWDTVIPLHCRHFVRHRGISNPICIKLLQLMSGDIAHNSVENEVSILINDWVTANYSVSWPQFWAPSWNLFRICVILLQLMFGVIMHNSVKKTKSPC